MVLLEILNFMFKLKNEVLYISFALLTLMRSTIIMLRRKAKTEYNHLRLIASVGENE